ncbi:peptidoglycan-binding protein [Aerococcaceae bacterium WGS1372]
MKRKFLLPLVLLSASSIALSVSSPVNNTLSFNNPVVVQAQEPTTVKIAYLAPHGDKSFASVTVVMQGDVIVDAQIDEFQFVEGDDWTGVPNSDATFGEGSAEGFKLISKREDSEGYSALMTELAESTVAYSDNLDAIEEFAKGKTVAEIEEGITALNDLGEEGNVSDVISGATLVDSAGYLQAIIDAANDGIEFAGSDADAANLELKQTVAAPHGDQSFAIVTAVVDGDTVVASTIDEFQFVEGDQWTGVPNSDAAFGENYAEGVTLISKVQNSDEYSALMTDIAGSTTAYADNIKAITDFTAGKTIAELEEAIAELQGLGEEGNVADVVSGSTLSDTSGYLQAIVDVANQ